VARLSENLPGSSRLISDVMMLSNVVIFVMLR